MPFHCSICEEESTKICIACTKDTCQNHLCEKCGRCSDCCGCEVALDETDHAHLDHVPVEHAMAGQTTTMSAGSADPLLAAESLIEPAGIPAEDVAGEASDEELPR
jgi:hypothetical protein